MKLNGDESGTLNYPTRLERERGAERYVTKKMCCFNLIWRKDLILVFLYGV